MSRFAFTPKSGGQGPADLGDMQGDTEGRSIFRTATARKDPEKIRRINALRGLKPHPKRGRAQTAPASRALGSDSTANILASYNKIWVPKAVQGKFGPAEMGDRQEDTAGRVLFRHNPGSKTLKAVIATSSSNTDNKENHPVDINRLLQDLSFLQRSSVFPGSVFSVPKKSVSQSMMEECRVFDPEYRVDKTHMPVKYEMKSFMEAEFARRLLAKAMVKETSPPSLLSKSGKGVIER
eukprot:CAMPEP_0173071870 /NCGR_PEP_ID=MMETSP1102-20130122/9486_1 /TAXON_ID=49646 /ORGANISM="Geminigera sp., Strain Caron Lab Isolate" /LENGTH=236 /DNA_ID=CAMNT_0013940445 /DNA_START=167 /DNA_END=878 /DNA_ORIENTATION=+